MLSASSNHFKSSIRVHLLCVSVPVASCFMFVSKCVSFKSIRKPEGHSNEAENADSNASLLLVFISLLDIHRNEAVSLSHNFLYHILLSAFSQIVPSVPCYSPSTSLWGRAEWLSVFSFQSESQSELCSCVCPSLAQRSSHGESGVCLGLRFHRLAGLCISFICLIKSQHLILTIYTTLVIPFIPLCDFVFICVGVDNDWWSILIQILIFSLY